MSGCGFFPTSDSKTYEVVTCTAPSAVFVSPNYPIVHESGLDREWNIRTSVGTYIEVTFKEFNVSSPTTHCEYDYLEFISGDTKTSLCNANIEEHKRKFKSDKNDLTIRFNRGLFYATYHERRFSRGMEAHGEIL